MKLNVSSLKPRLLPCSIVEGENKIIIESNDGQHIVMPLEYLNILNFLDGENSINQILTEIYRLEGKISFKNIVECLQLLNEFNLLEENEYLDKYLPKRIVAHVENEPLALKDILTLKLFNKVVLPIKSSYLFYIVSLAVMITPFIPIGFDIFEFDYKNFLSKGNYNYSLLTVFIISSVLLTLKNIQKSIFLLLSTGSIYSPSISLKGFALYYKVHDETIYTLKGNLSIVLYTLSSGLSYLFFAKSLSFIVPAYSNDISIIAALLTLIELDPYRKSEFTKTLRFFFDDGKIKKLMPYLKNSSLTSFAKKGHDLEAEAHYVIYSATAIIWATAFTLFSIDLIVSITPQLVYQMQLGSTKSMINAIGVLIGLGSLTFTMMKDLFHTLVKNMLTPLRRPVAGFKKKSKIVSEEDMTLKEITELLKSSSFFKDLSESDLMHIATKATFKKMSKERDLINQGDTAKSFYFLLKGTIDIITTDDLTKQESIITTINVPTVIGETAIISDAPRQATVRASTEILFLEFDGEVLKQISEHENFKQLKLKAEIAHFVSSAEMFRNFPSELMNKFINAGDLTYFPKGNEIVSQGEEDRSFFLLIRGKVDVEINNEFIAKLDQGNFFGEIALFANIPRTATIHAIEDCLLLIIESKDFWALLSENMELGMFIENVGQARMERNAA